MSLKFGEAKDINVGEMQIFPIRTEDDKPLFVTTGKCFSFGVKHEKKFNMTSMSLKLDDASTASLKNILEQCESHLGKPLPKKVFLQRQHGLSQVQSDDETLRGCRRSRRFEIREPDVRRESRFRNRWYFVKPRQGLVCS